MTEQPPDEDPFVREIRRQAERVRRGRQLSFWQGLGMVGAVGWMIVLPTLAGALGGRWLDGRFGSGFVCTLSLLALGLVAGCISAWRYVQGELHK